MIYLKVSWVKPITNSQISCFEIDWWFLVIESVIFWKVFKVGPMTDTQISRIEVDWWLLFIDSMIFLKMGEVGPITNSQISALKLTGEYISLIQGYIWRCAELVP